MSVKRFPGETDEAYPEVYTVPPPQPKEKKPGQLSEDMVKQYFEEGFVVIEDYFEKELLDDCLRDIEGLVEDVAQKLYKAGKVKNLYKEFGVYERLTKLENEFPGANIVLLKLAYLTPAFRAVFSNERLLNVVEQLLGPEIAGGPVWNMRTKTPHNDATTVPWHQDSAYMDHDSYSAMIVVAWIPLLDADERNGCMEMIRRGHQLGKICQHEGCWSDTWYIEIREEEMVKKLGIDLQKDIVSCPVKYGGLVLLNNMIPHRSLPNVSDKVRWSLDFRWQDPGKPYGFYGLKEGVVMRSAKNPVETIAWEPFDSVDRNKLQTEQCEDNPELGDINTIVTGPWMLKWEITHENRHTQALSKTLREEQCATVVA